MQSFLGNILQSCFFKMMTCFSLEIKQSKLPTIQRGSTGLEMEINKTPNLPNTFSMVDYWFGTTIHNWSVLMPNYLLLPFIQAFCCHSNLWYKNMVANILLLLILVKYMALHYTGQQQKPYPYLTILINRCHPGFCRTISTKIAISSVSMDNYLKRRPVIVMVCGSGRFRYSCRQVGA